MVGALHKLEVMDAAMGTCDCQTHADDGRRRGRLCCQHSSVLFRGQKRKPKNSTHRVSCDPLAPRDRESAALPWSDRHRDSSAFVPYFGKWVPGASPASESPSYEQPLACVPGAVSGQSLPVAGIPGMGGWEWHRDQSNLHGQRCWVNGAFLSWDNAKRKECYQVVEGQAPIQQMLPS